MVSERVVSSPRVIGLPRVCADPAPLQVKKRSAVAQGDRCTRWVAVNGPASRDAGALAALQPVTIRMMIMTMVSTRTPMMMNVATRFR